MLIQVKRLKTYNAAAVGRLFDEFERTFPIPHKLNYRRLIYVRSAGEWFIYEA